MACHKEQLGTSIAVLVLVTATASADRLTPKPQAEDYPHHVKVGNVEIAADYLVHTFSSRSETFFARDYLVFEVALYPEAGASYKVDYSLFTLRLNGRKEVLFPQEPGLVAYSMRNPDLDANPHPRLEGGVGIGGVGATIGRPVPGPRFPTDPTPAGRTPPRAPEDTSRQNVSKEPRATPEEVLRETALEGGEHQAAISGYIFFAYSGNVQKLKSVELLYHDSVGVHALRLQ